jgi:DNA-directed RNA polymerase subunit RPC12/RpoP
MAAWHPCNDGIDPIANAIRELIAFPVTRLAGSLEATSTRPSGILRHAYTQGQSAGRSPGRVEMVRRWLQFTGKPQDAEELKRLLHALMDVLSKWESDARKEAINRAQEIDEIRAKGGFVEVVDELGETACKEFNDVLDTADDALTYLLQLSAMVRASLATKQTSADPPMPMDVATAAEKWGVVETTVTRWCNKKQIPGAMKEHDRWSIPHDATPPRFKRKATTRSPRLSAAVAWECNSCGRDFPQKSATKPNKCRTCGSGALTRKTTPRH